MKKLTKLSLFLIIFSIAIGLSAQDRTSSLKGSVIDTLNKVPLSNAVILVLRKKDSVMVKFTRSDKAGGFEIKNLSAGQHIVLVSYPNYADYTDIVDLENGKIHELGKVPVITKARLLEEVIVKCKATGKCDPYERRYHRIQGR
ncbi:MAG: carboxypeptidase-like regulatory domain-containing protein [Chitinophagaceae bacterium]|nr:carboxypeptidase-like regulatory domain-containing protein [Chitinophagaceae bacterium]